METNNKVRCEGCGWEGRQLKNHLHQSPSCPAAIQSRGGAPPITKGFLRPQSIPVGKESLDVPIPVAGSGLEATVGGGEVPPAPDLPSDTTEPEGTPPPSPQSEVGPPPAPPLPPQESPYPDVAGLVREVASAVITQVNERLQEERQALDQKLQEERGKVADAVRQVQQEQQPMVVEAVINHFQQRIAEEQAQQPAGQPGNNGGGGAAGAMQYLALIQAVGAVMQPKQSDWKSAMEMFQGLMSIFGGGVGFASNIFSTAVKGGASADRAAEALSDQAGKMGDIFKPPAPAGQ